jgi:hypothetical protein
MLTAEEWRGGTEVAKALWLASLDDVQVCAQASVLATARRMSGRLVILGWVALGLLPAERLGPVLVAKATNPMARAVGEARAIALGLDREVNP